MASPYSLLIRLLQLVRAKVKVLPGRGEKG
jgi:hypothetical protein